MLKKIAFALLLALFGGVLISSGWFAWKDDPLRTYRPIAGTIVSHQVTIDRKRWDAKEKDAMMVETRVRAADGTEPVLRQHFPRPDSAWKFVSSHAVGGANAFFRSPDGDDFKWGRENISGDVWAIIVGSVLLIAGGAVLLPGSKVWFQHVGGALFCFAFFFGGAMAAWSIWPSVFSHVAARNWSAVPYELIGERTTGSESRPSTRPQ
jgi:hypothetical protein